MRLLRRFSALRTRRLTSVVASARRASSSRRTVSLPPPSCSASISSTPARTRSISSWRRSRARSAATSGGSGWELTDTMLRTVQAGIPDAPVVRGPIWSLTTGASSEGYLSFEGEEAEAADRQFVAISEATPLDYLAVDEDAVEAAVVEDPQRVGQPGDDQGMAAGDAGVVEGGVGGGAGGGPRPSLRDREDLDLAVLVVGDVATRKGKHRARHRKPVRRRGGGRDRDL